MIEKTFGHKKYGVIYKERIGVYGIGFNKDGKIPVIMKYICDGENAIIC